MKTLFLLRHAKSSWDNPNDTDFERPLNKRGLKTAPFMGEILAKRKIQPGLILSSPAMRAKQTAVLVKESAKFSAEITFEKRIYEASLTTMMEILSEIDDKFASVLIVGHNPSIEYLIRALSGEIQPIPTATFTKINMYFEKWDELYENCGEIEFIIRPKDEMSDTL